MVHPIVDKVVGSFEVKEHHVYLSLLDCPSFPLTPSERRRVKWEEKFLYKDYIGEHINPAKLSREDRLAVRRAFNDLLTTKRREHHSLDLSDEEMEEITEQTLGVCDGIKVRHFPLPPVFVIASVACLAVISIFNPEKPEHAARLAPGHRPGKPAHHPHHLRHLHHAHHVKHPLAKPDESFFPHAMDTAGRSGQEALKTAPHHHRLDYVVRSVTPSDVHANFHHLLHLLNAIHTTAAPHIR